MELHGYTKVRSFYLLVRSQQLPQTPMHGEPPGPSLCFRDTNSISPKSRNFRLMSLSEICPDTASVKETSKTCHLEARTINKDTAKPGPVLTCLNWNSNALLPKVEPFGDLRLALCCPSKKGCPNRVTIQPCLMNS